MGFYSSCYSHRLLTKLRIIIVVLSGINTSDPIVPMYESRKIHAGLIFASNPDVTWTMKVCSMYQGDPN